MAKYGINPEGVASLNQLATDLQKINRDIEECGKKLKTTVGRYGDQLGIYEDQINELVNSVTGTQKNGREAIDQLTASVKKMAQDVQGLVNAGLGS